MSEKGKEEARRLLQFWSIAQRVKDEGRLPISVDMGPVEGNPDARAYEQHVAVAVKRACGWLDFGLSGRAHGGCGRRWTVVKLEGDPDPPHDPDVDGKHDDCAMYHRLGCPECAAQHRAREAARPVEEEE